MELPHEDDPSKINMPLQAGNIGTGIAQVPSQNINVNTRTCMPSLRVTFPSSRTPQLGIGIHYAAHS